MGKKITELEESTVVDASNDYIFMVDVSDTFMSLGGSTKKLNPINLPVSTAVHEAISDANPLVVIMDTVYGTIGDNVTDNTSALMQFNAWAKNQDSLIIAVFSNKGTYRYTNNTWIYGIKNLIVNGNGSTFKNVCDVDDTFDYGFKTAAGFNIRNNAGVTPDRVPAYFINTVSAGTDTVTFTTSAELSNISIGEYVCVGSHGNYPSGYPPSWKNFDYVKVIDKTSTTLQFDRKLRYNYRSDDVYVSSIDYSGKAAVYKIEAGSKWYISHTYNDCIFETINQSEKTADYVSAAGYSITFNRCTAYAWNPTEAGTVRLNSCIGLANNEFDKLVENVEATDCTFKTIGNGVSVERAKFKNCIIGAFDLFSAKSIEILDSRILGNNIFGRSGMSIDSLVIKDTSLVSQNFFSSINLSQQAKVQIGTGGVTLSGSTLTVPATHSTVSEFLARLKVGLVLNASSSSGGGYWLMSNKKAYVLSWTCDGTNVVIQLSLNFTPSITETFALSPEPEYVSIRNCNLNGTLINRDFALIGPVRIKNWSPTLQAPFNPELYLVPPDYNRSFGYPKEIRINVKKAYSGGIGGNVTLLIRNEAPDYLTVVTIDLKTVGVRRITREGSVGLTGTAGESSAFSLTRTSTDFISLVTLSSYLNYSSDTVSMLPIVDIEIDFD